MEMETCGQDVGRAKKGRELGLQEHFPQGVPVDSRSLQKPEQDLAASQHIGVQDSPFQECLGNPVFFRLRTRRAHHKEDYPKYTDTHRN